MSDHRQNDERVTEITFTLPAGHKWTTVEAALREAHDQEYELRMAFFLECERLKAEVERLEKTQEYLQNTLNQYALDDVMSQAQVERLTKAGDAMVPLLGRGDYDNARYDWNAAKEGKPSV
jgi:hypothetical protein